MDQDRRRNPRQSQAPSKDFKHATREPPGVRCESISEAFDHSDVTNELARALAPLSDREREVLRLRFGLGTDREYTLEEIGQRLSVTRERVRQIESRALQKLRATKQRELEEMRNRRRTAS